MTKAAIKQVIDEDPHVTETLIQLGLRLADWWQDAKHDFSTLAPEPEPLQTTVIAEGIVSYIALGGDKFTKVRRKLLHSIMEKFVPVGIPDNFQIAGVFVNWWDNIKYDLKTIMKSGWEPALIDDSYLIDDFFKAEQKNLDGKEQALTQLENDLTERVEEALTLVEYEPDDEDGEAKPTPKLAKDELKTQIDFYTKERKNASLAKPFDELNKKITEIETKIKSCKADMKSLKAELELKLKLKRYGADDEKEETKSLLEQIEQELSPLEQDKAALPENNGNRRKVSALTKQINAYKKNKDLLQAKLKTLDAMLRSIGGVITAEAAQKLILKKHFDLINEQLQRDLAAERRALIAAYENLFDKYFTSSQQMEAARNKTLAELNDFLTELKYL